MAQLIANLYHLFARSPAICVGFMCSLRISGEQTCSTESRIQVQGGNFGERENLNWKPCFLPAIS
jgi:hypothetical protein